MLTSILTFAQTVERTVEVNGVAFRQLIAYPQRGLSGRQLVETLVEARREYPHRMTLEQLNTVADAITKRYRAAGFKFHYAVLPIQKPKQGLVYFSVVEATLGDVQLPKLSGVDPKQILKLFEPLLNKPLYQPDIDQLMRVLKQQTATEVVAYYSRGSKPGEVRINVKLRQQSVGLSVRLDNYGSESTGENRLLLQGQWHSPMGRFDRLSLAVMAADGDESNTYGSLSYSAPLWNLDNRLTLSASNNQFGLGEDFADLELDGDARIFDLAYDRQLTRGISASQGIVLSASYKETDYESPFNDKALEQDEEATALNLGWNLIYHPPQSSQRLHTALQLTAGDYEISGFTDGEQSFSKLQLSNQWRFGIGPAGRTWAGLLQTSLRGQYSEDGLPSFEKLLLTGGYGVRAFQPGFFAAERGALLSVEWYMPWLFSDPGAQAAFTVTPFVFIDAAYGEKLLPNDQVFDRGRLAAAGLGLDVFLGKHWYLQLLTAADIEQDIASELEAETMDVFMQLNFQL